MDLAFRLLKMPVYDTDVPGVRFAEGWGNEVDEARAGPGVMGNVPMLSSGHGDSVDMMTPNEYMDMAMQGFYPNREPEDHVSPWRWKDDSQYGHPVSDDAHNRQNVRRLVEGVGEGKVMGMPSLFYGNVGSWQEPDYSRFLGQEGGHRMEALRQMGHGDTAVPVAVRRKRDEM